MIGRLTCWPSVDRCVVRLCFLHGFKFCKWVSYWIFGCFLLDPFDPMVEMDLICFGGLGLELGFGVLAIYSSPPPLFSSLPLFSLFSLFFEILGFLWSYGLCLGSLEEDLSSSSLFFFLVFARQVDEYFDAFNSILLMFRVCPSLYFYVINELRVWFMDRGDS